MKNTITAPADRSRPSFDENGEAYWSCGVSFKISRWVDHFPEGVSRATYVKIGALIRIHGTQYVLSLREATENELLRALRRLEAR